MVDLFAHVTLKFDGWPRKTIRHLFYTTTSFVHHLKAIGEFKLWVMVRKRSIRVKIDDFVSCLTLRFERWPWKTIRLLFYASSSFVNHFVAIGDSNWSYSPETPNLDQIRRYFEPRDLEIWQMTFKNYRVHLQCYFKLCASFRSHWWIQTGVTVRKRPIWVKCNDF